MTRYIYPGYHELCGSAPVLARKVLIRAYEELGSISAVAKALGTTRKTVRKVLRRWEEEAELGLKDRSRRPWNSPRRTSLVEHKITLQTDNGEEFGGKSVDKLEYLNRRVFAPLKAELLHIPRGKKEYQAFVERSHQSDDNEFYLPQIERCADLKEFYFRDLRWPLMYNTRRYHSTPGMTPYRKLRTQMQISKQVALFPVIQMEKLTDLYQKLFPPAWIPCICL